MKTKDAIKEYGNGSKRKLAELLDISVQAVQAWPEDVPKLREYQLKDIKKRGFKVRVKPVI